MHTKSLPRLAAVLSAVTAVVVTATVAAGAVASTTPAVDAARAASAPVTYTFAGDSVTQASNKWSWVKYVDTRRAKSVGGVAAGGLTSATVAAQVTHRDADVLVVMVGVGDVRNGVSPATVRKNIGTIVRKVGARHVLLAAVPPCDRTADGPQRIDRRAAGFVLDRSLQEFASSRGWGWVDPFSSVRHIDNTWSAGTSSPDGVHPTATTAKRYLGPRMTVAVTQSVTGAKP
ncbi:lysophospholipase L1-like esterase [Curtobacterium flaccumfaciens]|uniref:Lysophospholipase L1-like esterase n=1 Tax=Curtobacterium salicis TaxID=1779862 RepID=A0ABX0T4N6_9MICO|nr:lysophospholipase L1-like esterase [Curtobacterium sp. WW7]